MVEELHALGLTLRSGRNVIGSRDGSASASSHIVAKLIDRACDGDESAFGEIYRLYRDPIYRMARFYVGTGADRVVEQVFLRAWVSLRRRRAGEPLLAWLYGFARQVLWDELDDRAERSGRSEVFGAEGERPSIANAIRGLPAEQRQVVEMKLLLGMTNVEVAAALGVTANAVNSRQWRALNVLRDELESVR